MHKFVEAIKSRINLTWTAVAVVVIIVFALMYVFLTKTHSIGQATLTWNKNIESNIAGYKVYYGTVSRKGDCPKDGGYEKWVDTGTTTTYLFKNLDNKSTYFFSVTSYNNAGKESCFSAEVNKKLSVSFRDRVKYFFTRQK
ncbi:MAG: fibronectin type III domain-containing protein [bacterium]